VLPQDAVPVVVLAELGADRRRPGSRHLNEQIAMLVADDHGAQGTKAAPVMASSSSGALVHVGALEVSCPSLHLTPQPFRTGT